MTTLVTRSNCWQRSTDQHIAHDHIVTQSNATSALTAFGCFSVQPLPVYTREHEIVMLLFAVLKGYRDPKGIAIRCHIDPQERWVQQLDPVAKEKSRYLQRRIQYLKNVVSDSTPFYYPTSLRRVQITLKTSTNITRYLYSRGPVRQVFSQLASDELDWSYEKKFC